MRNRIYYRSGYKYQLCADYEIDLDRFGTGPHPEKPISTDWITLSMDGVFLIKCGYAWDGPSYAVDTKNFMRGSLVHDALYQLMRDGHLDHEIYREVADRLLRKICIQDGMSKIRAWWVYQAVRIFADPCADPASKKPVEYAP